MALLQVSGISKKEHTGFLLHNISLKLEKGQKLAISGETGAGKSTLMKIIAGLVQPSSGTVHFKGQQVKGPEEKLVPGHAGIAYLSQQYELPQFLRVEQVLSYANTLPAKAAGKLYEICQINQLLSRKTDQLSGGERQRIALARLLSSAPGLLLLDEPYSNLDLAHKEVLKSVLHDLGQQLKVSAILVSHDPHDSLSWADQLLVLKAGEQVQNGTPEQIYRQPANVYVAGLFGRYNLLKAKALEGLPGIRGAAAEEKNLLIRPESFKITAAQEGSLAGKVKKVLFYGNYYALEVAVKDQLLQVETPQTHLKKGDALRLYVSPADVWHIT